MHIIVPDKQGGFFGEDTLHFSDGSYIWTTHAQECCEHNYADFSILETMPDVLNAEFDCVILKEPEDRQAGGFIMRLENGETFGHKNVFIPCYSSQNGYYSATLEVYLHDSCGNCKQSLFISAELI